jgi:drug/metabolite transporter (DMT)-like permease
MLLALAAIWGASFLFIKVAVRDFEPATLVFGRVLLAALTLLPIALATTGLGGLRRSWLGLAVMGALNSAIPFWLLSFGETRLDSGLTAVIQAAAPIFTVLIALRYDPSQRAAGSRLAGVSNSGKNVFGLMPHPEHAVDSLTGSTDGAKLFQSMLEHCMVH